MKKFAVIGHPVVHSLSPLIHNHWMAAYGFDARYDVFDIAPDRLENELYALRDDGYEGFNVTLPHKIAVMDLCDFVDDSAKRIGAVNMLAVDAFGNMGGYNTDAFGFVENIKMQQPAFDFKSGAAVVLGAGGATRAVIDGLVRENVPDIIIMNRTREKAEEIARSYNVRVLDWAARHDALSGAGLLINATSLGMDGQSALTMHLDALPAAAVVADIVYKPLVTDLLRDAESRGHDIVGGLGMLLHQARPSFEKWFGVLPDIDDDLCRKIEREAVR